MFRIGRVFAGPRQAYRRHNKLTDQIDTLTDKLEQADQHKALLDALEQVLGDEWGTVKEAEKLMNKQSRR